jgi:Arc/MetJ family transcription regulator
MTRKIRAAIDQELFEEARRILGTRTMQETIEKALREVVRRQAQKQEVRALSAMKGLDLADGEVMAGAWRS